MQYRNRFINVGILHDAEIAAGGPVARDLAFGLMLLADDQGRLRAVTKTVWKEVHRHMEDVSLRACRSAFDHLAFRARFVLLYRFDDEIFAVIRNWHRFQPQKVDRVRWSRLPAPPDFIPEKVLPGSLLTRWQTETLSGSFEPPPISNAWISGDGWETQRRQLVPRPGDIVSPAAEPPVRRPAALARAERMKGRTDRTDESRADETRGDNALRDPDEADPALLASTAVHENGRSGSRAEASDWSDWEVLTPGKRQLRLTNWLWYEKHQWSSVKPKTRDHEAGIAALIAGFAVDGPTLLTHLTAWWDESDPDDRPSSLEYFWTRLQMLESEDLKQKRGPHVDTSLTKAGESLPDIQSQKGSKS